MGSNKDFHTLIIWYKLNCLLFLYIWILIPLGVKRDVKRPLGAIVYYKRSKCTLSRIQRHSYINNIIHKYNICLFKLLRLAYINNKIHEYNLFCSKLLRLHFRWVIHVFLKSTIVLKCILILSIQTYIHNT